MNDPLKNRKENDLIGTDLLLGILLVKKRGGEKK